MNHPAIPPDIALRPVRDTRLDIVRGWLQLTIFASHTVGSFIGGWLIHSAWGLSDSSELFVFLSGYTLGSVFVLKMTRNGFASATRDMVMRAVRLYRTHLLIAALFFAMLLLACHFIPLPQEAQRLGWSYFLDQPLRALPGLLSMLYQPAFMGILPVFIWCMLLLPAFAWAQARVGDAVLALSVALYASVWLFGLAVPNLGRDTTVAFDPFAWQLLFLGGAWLGRRALLLGEALPRLPWLTVAAALILAAGLYLRLSWYEILPTPFAEHYWLTSKDLLGLPRVLHALALAWIVACLLPREAGWMNRALPRWLAAIGRHSLQVFCLGLFLSWGAAAAFRLWPALFWLLDLPLILSGAIILALFAHWLDGRRTRAVRHPGPVAASGRGTISPAGAT